MNPNRHSGLSPPQRMHQIDSEPRYTYSSSSSLISLKKPIPIKKNDAEMLTRRDIQFDLLRHIFSDNTKAFTDQTPGNPSNKITFGELYKNALYLSTKCSKVLKDKMKDTPAFAIELAKISLLANVGRINTTMAFFPEMKTALRTYHPVPSLQKTDGNLQDAPRIKNCLKAALLPSEQSNPPTSLAEILEKLRLGQRPPTSIVNLIFVMANHTTLLGRTHFDQPVDFIDLFMPLNVPSAHRARVFLWLVYHYIEDPSSPNPFDDEYSNTHTDKVPWLPHLTDEEMRELAENEDLPEEVEWGSKMCAQRTGFLQKLVSSAEAEKKNKNVFKPPQVLELAPRRPRAPRQVYEGDDGEGFRHYTPNASVFRRQANISRGSPYPIQSPDITPQRIRQNRRRSMLEHAFHIVTTTDPLADSDDEDDEHVRLDYDRRLQILNRLRGKPPTPPPSRTRSPSERRDLSRNHRRDTYSRTHRRPRTWE